MANPAWFKEVDYLNSKLEQLNKVDPSAGWTLVTLNRAIADAGYTPFTHFEEFGSLERTSPNAYFDANQYLANKADQLNATEGGNWDAEKVALAIDNAGMTIWGHFQQHGWQEGVNPSNQFDVQAYLEAKAEEMGDGATVEDVKQALIDNNLDPITHYEAYGKDEGVEPVPVSGGAGETFTLTTGVDIKTLDGTFEGPVLFNPGTGTQVNSLQTGDKLTGAGEADVLNAALITGATPTLTGIETINLETFGNNTLVAGAITGTTAINTSVAAGLTQTITGLAAGVKLGVSGAGTLTSTQASETGTANKQVYELNKANGATITGSASIEKQDFVSTGGTANSFTLTNLTAATAANKTEVSGDTSVTVRMAGANPFSGAFIDGSGLTNDAKLTLRMNDDQIGQTINAANFTGVSKLVEAVSNTGATTYQNYKSGLTLEFAESDGTDHVATNLVANNAGLTGSSDVLNVSFTGSAANGGVGGTTSAVGVETLNVLATTTAATPGTLTFGGTTTLAVQQIGKTSTIKIDGASNQAVTFTGAVAADVVDASAATKALTVTATGSQIMIKGSSVADSITHTFNGNSVIEGGAGNDSITIGGGAGNAGNVNVINGGAGVDTITLISNQNADTVVFGGSSTWGDSVANLSVGTNTSVDVGSDVLNFSKADGFAELKKGTSIDVVNFSVGAGASVGANNTIVVNTTIDAAATTAAAFAAKLTASTAEAVGDSFVYLQQTGAAQFHVYHVESKVADNVINANDAVTLVGTLTGVTVDTAWNANDFLVA